MPVSGEFSREMGNFGSVSALGSREGRYLSCASCQYLSVWQILSTEREIRDGNSWQLHLLTDRVLYLQALMSQTRQVFESMSILQFQVGHLLASTRQLKDHFCSNVLNMVTGFSTLLSFGRTEVYSLHDTANIASILLEPHMIQEDHLSTEYLIHIMLPWQ